MQVRMEVGAVVGEWTCRRILGRGNFGVVALWVTNSHPEQSRAIKMFQPGASWDQATIRQVTSRWVNEVDIMCNQVESPFIVTTLPLPDELRPPPGSPPLLALEFCSGGDLRQILRQPQNAAGLQEKEVRKILRSIGGAISYLHSIRIIHRDLKPENILLTSPREGGVYKLADLGFAKGLLQSDSHCSTIVGTVQYLAPEIYLGKSYDVAVDFWSFGVIAFEICCGVRPFLHGHPASEWIPFVEDKGDDVIAIYEGKDGKPVSSTTFPYTTHLSARLRQCLEMWLKAMLQRDPKKRGKRTEGSASIAGDETGGSGLRVLETILDMDMLDVNCLLGTNRLSFAVGNSTTFADISGWIERDSGVKVDEQLLISSNGIVMDAQETVLQFFSEQDGTFSNDPHLFMIPKNFEGEALPVPPPFIHEFISESSSPTLADHRRLSHRFRRIWPSLIYFLQKSLNQIETLRKAERAVRAHNDTVLYPTEWPEEIRTIKAGLMRLEGILSLEEEIRNVERGRNFPQTGNEMLGKDLETESADEKDLYADLKAKVSSVLEIIEGNEEEFTMLYDHMPMLCGIHSLDIHYHRILKCLETWREGGGLGNVGPCINKFLAVHQTEYSEAVRLLRDVLDVCMKAMKILQDLKKSATELEDMKVVLINCRLEKQRRLLTNQKHSQCVGENGDGIQNLMTESIMLEAETDEILKRSLEGAEEIQDSHQRLDWTFLNSFE